MSTQQDIYAAGSESRPPMLNKENYVPRSSRLLRYAKSRPNGKLIHNSIINGPYVRRMIPEPGDTNREVPVNETFHKDVDELKAERLAKIQDPLALMATSNNHYNFPVLKQDQPSFNQNYMQQPMPNPKDIIDPATAMNMALALMAKTFKLNYSTPTNNNQRISSNPRNRQIAQPGMNMGQDRQMQMVGGNGENQFRQYVVQNIGNMNGYNANGNGNLVVARAEGNAAGHNGNQIRCYNCRGVGYFARNCTVRLMRRDDAYLQTQLLIAQKEEAGIQLQAEEFDLIAATANLDEIEEVNANCILMANLQQASTSGTQTNKAPVYDSDRSAEVHDYENYDDNEIFNMFTQEEQYIELLEPIPEPHQVPQNDNSIISKDSSVEQSGETVEQHPVNFEKTRAPYDSLYQNLAIKVDKVNTVDRKLKETNADLTTELARFKNQEKCFEISQEKYDKLDRCYQQSVYQEKCLSKKINALHLSFGKQIMTLNEEISDLNKHNSKEKSTVSFLLEEKKRLKSNFKTCEDELLDKQIQLEKKIKELNNILVKTGQTIQMIHMLSPKPDSFYHTEQKMALAKFVRDFKSLAKEADESLAKHKALELEIKRLLRAVASQDIMSVVQKGSVVNISNLQTELERTKERFENCIIKKENEYAKLWNDWYKKCDECKFDKISYDKAYKDMQQKIERLQAQLRDLKGKSKDTLGIDNTRTRRPQPRSNTKNDRVPSASKSSRSKNKDAKVEEHRRNLLLSKNTKYMPSACNNIKLDSQNVISKDVCAMCKQCLISINHDVCLLNYVNGKTSRGKKQIENVSIKEKQKKHQPMVKKTKKVGFIKRLATPKPRKSRFFLRWSPARRLFDLKGKIIKSSKSESQSDCSNGDNACTSNTLKPKIRQFPNSTSLLGRLFRFVYGQFCDSDLEVAFKRNACFVRNLEGFDLLKGDHSTNLYTINLHEMAFASPICLMARASSTKSWLWHQRLSYLNFDTINDLARNDLVLGLPKFKYHKEHLCPSCEQGKCKRASHPPKPVPNSRQRALCYPKNDRQDIGKLDAKGDISFFIGYSADSCAYIVFNQRTKKIIETMNVSFDELSAMAFEQCNSKSELQSMTSRQISSVLELTYAPSTIITQATEGELDLLFEAMYDDYIGGQPLATARTVPAA
nr:integrase, catalytic region, zinc finger, CCHC-type, peptidase aspartic, catalytic [Tanacetum cinerariifolium]